MDRLVTGIYSGLLAFAFTSLFHYNLGEDPLAMVVFFPMGWQLHWIGLPPVRMQSKVPV